MAHLTLAGLSEDGKRLLLVDERGTEHTLAIDAKLRAALRGEHARIGQLEITMDSALRPRDIQARIRAGATPEAVAQAAQTTVDRVMGYATPVLAERAHVAQRAQRSSVRRRSGESGARTLGEAVALHLRSANVDPDTVEWDAWRREDGRWTLTGSYSSGSRSGTATFTYDMRGNFVTMDDDHAKWLVGEGRDTERRDPPAGDQPRGRRLAAVPTTGADGDELPFGEDVLSMVSDEERAAGDEAGAADRGADEPTASETTLDLERTAAPESSEVAESTDDEPAEAGVAEEKAAPARRTSRKSRGRASVPSWDEIMFGGGKQE